MDKAKETLGKILNSLKERWKALDRKIKILIIAIASVMIVSLIVLIIINSITRYEVLYTGADPKETQEILTVLQTDLNETDVKVDSATGDIKVPANRVDDLKAQLSIKGYPKSTFNYDVWDSGVGMFSTESDKRIKEKQQLQENLRATLATYDGVQSALVLLTIPDSNDYVISTSHEEAGASVVLQLEHALTADTVEGIYHLIRTAVPGLKTENISVTDGSGQLLTADSIRAALAQEGEDETEHFYKRLEFQNTITKILNDKLADLFNGAFNDYRVAVDVQLNYDAQVKQTTEYTPSVDSEGTRGGMVDSEKYVSSGGGNAVDGGIVGTTIDADISPDYPTLRIGDGDEFFYESQKEIHYLVNQAITQVEKDGYSYDNISASVLVDEDAENVTQADVENWEKLIATAIGTSADKVSFKATNFQLDKTGNQAGDGSVVVQGNRNTLVFIIIALGSLLVILLVIALLAAGSNKKRIKARRAAAIAASSGANPSAVSINYDEEDMKARAEREAAEEFEIQSLSGQDNEASRDALLKKEIRDFSTTNPEIVAQLIRTWMRGDE